MIIKFPNLKKTSRLGENLYFFMVDLDFLMEKIYSKAICSSKICPSDTARFLSTWAFCFRRQESSPVDKEKAGNPYKQPVKWDVVY